MLLVWLTGVVFVTLAFIYRAHAQSKRSSTDLRGPNPLPVIGNLLEVDPDALCESLQRLSMTYGKVYRVMLPTSDFIVVADPELYKEILSSDWEVRTTPKAIDTHRQ
jgi:hypothetical protein